MAVAYYYSSVAGEYTLAGAISAGATSITLDTVTGLPTVPFKLVLEPGAVTEEIVKVTNVAGTNLTVVRGHDGTTGVTHDALAKARHMMTAEDLRLSREHEDATVAHGATGAVVGTTNTQTLTNKNLTSGTNTFPSSLATDAEVTAAVSAHSGSTAAHGATGAVVGTTNTQILSNKTLNSPTLSAPTFTGVANGDDLYLGSTTSTTQRMLRVRRLGSDAVSRDSRLAVSNDSLALLHYKSTALVNSLYMNSDGSSDLFGPLTIGGRLTAPSATIGGRSVPKFASGTVNVNISSDFAGAGTITFPVGRFSGTPIVTVTSRDSSFGVTTGTGSASNIPITVRHFDRTTVTATVTVSWIAIEE